MTWRTEGLLRLLFRMGVILYCTLGPWSAACTGGKSAKQQLDGIMSMCSSDTVFGDLAPAEMPFFFPVQGCKDIFIDDAGSKRVDVCDFRNNSPFKLCDNDMVGTVSECSDDCQKLLHVLVEYASHSIDRHQEALDAESKYRNRKGKIEPLLAVFSERSRVTSTYAGTEYEEHWRQNPGGCVDTRLWEKPIPGYYVGGNRMAHAVGHVWRGDEFGSERSVVAFTGKVLEISGAPVYWSGVVESTQLVTYSVVRGLSGATNSGQVLTVEHLVLNGSPLVASDGPHLDPDIVHKGQVLFVVANCTKDRCWDIVELCPSFVLDDKESQSADLAWALCVERLGDS